MQTRRSRRLKEKKALEEAIQLSLLEENTTISCSSSSSFNSAVQHFHQPKAKVEKKKKSAGKKEIKSKQKETNLFFASYLPNEIIYEICSFLYTFDTLHLISLNKCWHEGIINFCNLQKTFRFTKYLHDKIYENTKKFNERLQFLFSHLFINIEFLFFSDLYVKSDWITNCLQKDNKIKKILFFNCILQKDYLQKINENCNNLQEIHLPYSTFDYFNLNEKFTKNEIYYEKYKLQRNQSEVLGDIQIKEIENLFYSSKNINFKYLFLECYWNGITESHLSNFYTKQIKFTKNNKLSNFCTIPLNDLNNYQIILPIIDNTNNNLDEESLFGKKKTVEQFNYLNQLIPNDFNLICFNQIDFFLKERNDSIEFYFENNLNFRKNFTLSSLYGIENHSPFYGHFARLIDCILHNEIQHVEYLLHIGFHIHDIFIENVTFDNVLSFFFSIVFNGIYYEQIDFLNLLKLLQRFLLNKFILLPLITLYTNKIDNSNNNEVKKCCENFKDDELSLNLEIYWSMLCFSCTLINDEYYFKEEENNLYKEHHLEMINSLLLVLKYLFYEWKNRKERDEETDNGNDESSSESENDGEDINTKKRKRIFHKTNVSSSSCYIASSRTQPFRTSKLLKVSYVDWSTDEEEEGKEESEENTEKNNKLIEEDTAEKERDLKISFIQFILHNNQLLEEKFINRFFTEISGDIRYDSPLLALTLHCNVNIFQHFIEQLINITIKEDLNNEDDIEDEKNDLKKIIVEYLNRKHYKKSETTTTLLDYLLLERDNTVLTIENMYQLTAETTSKERSLTNKRIYAPNPNEKENNKENLMKFINLYFNNGKVVVMNNETKKKKKKNREFRTIFDERRKLMILMVRQLGGKSRKELSQKRGNKRGLREHVYLPYF
ncbi:hypothetical protein ABK040_008274 [Willaertia magna]